ncbi:MAG: hypothetical protein V3W34_13800 [Phycisphaerae bacterium]
MCSIPSPERKRRVRVVTPRWRLGLGSGVFGSSICATQYAKHIHLETRWATHLSEGTKARRRAVTLHSVEEFAVYDCRIRPNTTDRPSNARVFYFTYHQYPKQWNDIAGIFAKDAILKGSFDRYAESNKRKRGTAEVDTEFLKEIETWRETRERCLGQAAASLAGFDDSPIRIS